MLCWKHCLQCFQQSTAIAAKKVYVEKAENTWKIVAGPSAWQKVVFSLGVLVCFLSIWYSCKCVKMLAFPVFGFLGVSYSSLFGFGRFSVRWRPEGPTSPSPSFFDVCVFLVFFCYVSAVVAFVLFSVVGVFLVLYFWSCLFSCSFLFVVLVCFVCFCWSVFCFFCMCYYLISFLLFFGLCLFLSVRFENIVFPQF